MERLDPRVETLVGHDAPAFEAFDRVLNELTLLARGLATPGTDDLRTRGVLQERVAAADRARTDYGRLVSERR